MVNLFQGKTQTLKTIIAFFSLTIFFVFKIFGQQKQEKFLILATLKGFKDSTKFYLVNLDSAQNIDSTYLLHQKLLFKGRVMEPTAFRLYPEADDAYFNFWVENRTITLAGDRTKFSAIVVKGSPLNKTNYLVEKQHADLDKLRDSLTMKAVRESNQSKANEIWKSISAIDTKVKNIRLQTIATFQPSLVTIKELFFLRNDLSTDSLKILFNRFPSRLRNTKYGNVITQYISTDDLKIGVHFNDIKGKDLNNREVKLSDYKNKVILLDFWASWCGPCRSSNKQLGELFQKYNPSGFEVISFSLDTNPDAWNTASQKDSITWTNISDLKGFYSRQAASYKIRAIPKAFLIDRNGIVLKIFNGYSKDGKTFLENKIQELTK
jgi:thiol-disulfide isomerase/thioredoxin